MRQAFIAALASCAMATGAGAHDGPHTGPADAAFKVGKDGQIKIGEDLLVGTVMVKKGKYTFNHRVEDGRHIVTLTRVDAKVPEQAPVELSMRFLPSDRAVKRTAILAIETDARWLEMTIVEVAGEPGDHVLTPAGDTE